MTSLKFKAMFALAMVCFFWGTTWIATEEGVKHMPPLQMAGIRQLTGGVFYVIYFLAKGYRLPQGREWRSVIILSLLNFVLTNGLATIGMQYIDGGLAAIIAAIFPLWIVLIGLFRTGRMPPPKAVAGLILGFAGICIVFYNNLQDLFNANFRFGIILSLIASWTWAFGTLYTKSESTKFNPYFSIGLQMMISGLIMGGIALSTGATIPIRDIHWLGWASIGYLVFFGSILSFIAYLYALQHLPADQASIYAYVNPVVAFIAGFLIYGTPLTIYLAIGGTVILTGVYLVNKVYSKNNQSTAVSE
jgi:drug/metabolite transporter (DMT)-like permease